jgi:hypothetical protein
VLAQMPQLIWNLYAANCRASSNLYAGPGYMPPLDTRNCAFFTCLQLPSSCLLRQEFPADQRLLSAHHRNSCIRLAAHLPRAQKDHPMPAFVLDLIYLAIGVAAFAITALYFGACEKL